MKQSVQHVRQRIAKLGWLIARVEDKDAPFSHTLGLWESYQHPEVIIVGPAAPVCLNFLSAVGKRVREGEKFVDDITYIGIFPGYPAAFMPVAKKVMPGWFKEALTYYGSDFPAIQLVWPDKQRRFPWQRGAHVSRDPPQPWLWARS